MNLVWFKRDLRTHDHEPLVRAAQRGPILPLYVIEPEYWQLPDTSVRQYRFLQDSLHDLAHQLAELGQPLWIIVGDTTRVMEQLIDRFAIEGVYSHMETGNQWTFERDIKVGTMLLRRGVKWHQSRQHGVLRGLRWRDNWAKNWESLMGQDTLSAPSLRGPGSGPLEFAPDLAMSDSTLCRVQKGGSAAGYRALDGFLTERGEHYTRAMSSPVSGAKACSRISPHLALGTLSLRQTVQTLRNTEADNATWARSYQSLDKRLHWHCHFIQKLETEPRIEFEPLHRGFIGMKSERPDPEVLERWIEGQTGWPFVDACMRCLKDTGWINFRMRAMVVSLNAYHLWQPWRPAGLKLAQRFVDYEPGIHFSQIQMQSGTTGINVNRMYNPVKQSQDQDPEGEFIRRWVPELAGYSNEWIHQPWMASVGIQERSGAKIGVAYPSPIADPVQAAREARAKLSAHMKKHDMHDEAQRILKAHASQMKQTRPRYKKTETQHQIQLDLGE